MSTVTTADATPAEKSRVLSEAVLRAADLLSVNQATLGKILGISPASISRMRTGDYRLDLHGKEWEMAALFVRLFRSLDALLGSRDELARRWLTSANAGLGGVPAELIRTTEGLVRAVHYLDATRGRI